MARLFQAMVLLGILGFVTPTLLPYVISLRTVELPALFETTTIALPDGG